VVDLGPSARIATALRRLASDLIDARAEIGRLRRENTELRAQLDALSAEHHSPDHDGGGERYSSAAKS
jgi:hypothetical protein